MKGNNSWRGEMLTKVDGAHVSNKKADSRDETIVFLPGLPTKMLYGAFKKQ